MEKQQKNNIMIMSRSVSTSNAYEAYKQIDTINPYSVKDLKKIHGILIS